MKKAKIMLTAIALFGIVGGALAFKTVRGNNRFYSGPACTVLTFLPYTTIPYLNAPTVTLRVSTIAGGNCSLKTLYFDN